MRVYTFIDRGIKQVLRGEGVPSDIGWSRIFDTDVHVGYPGLQLETLSNSELSNIGVQPSPYLLEVEIDDILSNIDYMDYDNISSHMTSKGVDSKKILNFLRIAESLGESNEVVLYGNLTANQIVNIYRYNPVEPHWVLCDVIDGKLVHRVI